MTARDGMERWYSRPLLFEPPNFLLHMIRPQYIDVSIIVCGSANRTEDDLASRLWGRMRRSRMLQITIRNLLHRPLSFNLCDSTIYI